MARPPRDTPLAILHRDRDFLVVNKPAGLPTTAPDGGDCLALRVQRFDRDAERCHPSSRLDTDVTGVVVFARTSRGIDAVLEARASKRYARRYIALAHTPAQPSPAAHQAATNQAATNQAATNQTGSGLAASDAARWTWAIAIDPRDPRRRRALEPGEAGERAQEAATQARVFARAPRAIALVLKPITGRTHQLRVHAARDGVPLLGDITYGGSRRLTLEDGTVIACPRVSLHCLAVVIPGADGAPAVFHAPVPDDLHTLGRATSLEPFDEPAITSEAIDDLLQSSR